MSKCPEISVIITCYNYEQYVSLSIESVLSQSYQNFELIVINDGSTDNSKEVIDRYKEKITPIHTKNFGFISACLTGLSASRAPYIIFLDADDMLKPNALAAVSGHLSSEVSKIQFMLEPINASGGKIGDAFPSLPSEYSNDDMIKSINRVGYYSTPPTSGNIYRRDIYTDLDSISYDYGIDGVAYLAAPFKGKVLHLKEILGCYRIHNNNMSGFGNNQYLKMERDKSVFLKRLDHLSRIVAADKNASGKFQMKDDYLYVVERDVFISVSKGQRPSFKLTLKYLKEIFESFSGNARISFMVLAVGLFVLPNNARRSLVDFTINPAKESKLRTFVKRWIKG